MHPQLLPHPSSPGLQLLPPPNEDPRVARPKGLAWSPPAKFEPRRILGTGGMGTVMLARDRHLDRLVAIKILLTDCHQLLERLQQEARLLWRLEHPSIVRVYDLDVHERRLYLSMEYAAGGNLALARLEPEPLVRTVRGVVDALRHAHAHGIVHRDVKPENILLLDPAGRTSRGRTSAVLADFGLAAGPGEGDASLRRPIVGTPLTMSPEQVAGEPAGPTSDIFSLGVTLYRMLSGRWPFMGRNVQDVFDAIQTREPVRLRAAMSDPSRKLSRRLESIVMKAIAKDPVDRFESMAELGRALDRFLLARSLFRIPFTRGQRSPRTSRLRIHPENPK